MREPIQAPKGPATSITSALGSMISPASVTEDPKP